MLQFAKMEGCGNDFLVVDARDGAHGDLALLGPRAATVLCDRHFGVGGDGVLVISQASAPGALARMRVLNADGSEAEMCGNGLRCVTKYLYEQDAELWRSAIPIETGAGVLRCEVTLNGARRVTHVAVDMGRPRLARGEVPMAGPKQETALEQEVTLHGNGERRHVRLTAVSMGNPHAVLFIEGDEPLRELAERYGPLLERHEWFPHRTNVEFARVRPSGEIDLVVWERGCGITLACGTGACATAVAACLTRRARPGVELAVHLPGGSLNITVAADLGAVLLRGPATEVFRAEVDLAALLGRYGARA
ncbi:MAG TPA: diaminopimelate epimerase [Polyangia bacterium]|jgi:diaminopimelate epimerase|nr:diaminopimelate epimerase [Polyangia bacterium]